eukprot:1140150-Rhodomonas_salina.1
MEHILPFLAAMLLFMEAVCGEMVLFSEAMLKKPYGATRNAEWAETRRLIAQVSSRIKGLYAPVCTICARKLFKAIDFAVLSAGMGVQLKPRQRGRGPKGGLRNLCFRGGLREGLRAALETYAFGYPPTCAVLRWGIPYAVCGTEAGYDICGTEEGYDTCGTEGGMGGRWRHTRGSK